MKPKTKNWIITIGVMCSLINLQPKCFGQPAGWTNTTEVATLTNEPPFHWESKLVKVTCQYDHYYAIRNERGVTSLGAVVDHERTQFERELKPLPEWIA